jgi:hypothetical protein
VERAQKQQTLDVVLLVSEDCSKGISELWLSVPLELCMKIYSHLDRNRFEIRDLPETVAERCSCWFRHFKFWRRFYFTTGTVGAIVSALAATQLGQKAYLGAYLAVGASICFAVLGFTHPERNYFQFVRAWRVLDIACQRYQYDHKFTIEQLLDALQHGEQIIAEVEHIAQPTRDEEQKPQLPGGSNIGKPPQETARESDGVETASKSSISMGQQSGGLAHITAPPNGPDQSLASISPRR